MQASTSEVYGNRSSTRKGELWETSNPIGRVVLRRGKRCAETLFSTSIANTDSISRWPESLTPTAPGCTQTTAVGVELIVQALGQPITIYGDGQQTRPLLR